jgi:hypothetical protein
MNVRRLVSFVGIKVKPKRSNSQNRGHSEIVFYGATPSSAYLLERPSQRQPSDERSRLFHQMGFAYRAHTLSTTLKDLLFEIRPLPRGCLETLPREEGRDKVSFSPAFLA